MWVGVSVQSPGCQVVRSPKAGVTDTSQPLVGAGNQDSDPCASASALTAEPSLQSSLP